MIPVIPKARNNKKMNKRTPAKPKAKGRQLRPAVIKPQSLGGLVEPKGEAVKRAIDNEDMEYDFKSGATFKTTPELHEWSSGRLPDEFHNTEYQQRLNPGSIQPVHYDHFDPQVEGFFGAGYTFEPLERAHHEAEEHHHEQVHERSFTPGHFAQADYEDSED